MVHLIKLESHIEAWGSGDLVLHNKGAVCCDVDVILYVIWSDRWRRPREIDLHTTTDIGAVSDPGCEVVWEGDIRTCIL